MAYEQTISQEKLALIIDLGGGTSDFSVIHLRPSNQKASGYSQYKGDRRQDVLANKGIHIGGTDFDTSLSLETVMPELGLGGIMRGLSGNIQIPSSYYHDLTTWHTINSLYTHQTKRHLIEIYNLAYNKAAIKRLLQVIENQRGHKILDTIEQAKCYLSQDRHVNLNLNYIEEDFILNIPREVFETSIQDKVQQLISTLLDTVREAGVKMEQIDSVFFTGGSTQIPMIREAIEMQFPAAEMVKGDVFSSVGKGLIIEALQRYK